MTLKDVAALADCSVATVSKALKNSPEISEEAKARILAVAKESGYLKKATAHKAVLGGFKTILLNDPKGTWSRALPTLQTKAKKYGLTLLVSSLSEQDARELKEQLGAFGLILSGSTKTEAEAYILGLQDDLSLVEPFFAAVSEYRPRRPSRAGISQSKPTASAEPRLQKPAEPEKQSEVKKEEIWLL